MIIFRIVPAVVIAWASYHLVFLTHAAAFDAQPLAVLNAELLSLMLPNGGSWIISTGDLIIAFTVVTGFIEVLKASELSRVQLFDHVLATLFFAGVLFEFLYFKPAQTSVFFMIVLAVLLDVIVGYVVSVRVARRDFSLQRFGS